MVFKSTPGSVSTTAPTWASSMSAWPGVQGHPAHIPRRSEPDRSVASGSSLRVVHTGPDHPKVVSSAGLPAARTVGTTTDCPVSHSEVIDRLAAPWTVDVGFWCHNVRVRAIISACIDVQAAARETAVHVLSNVSRWFRFFPWNMRH